jgi:hypothetical protein
MPMKNLLTRRVMLGSTGLAALALAAPFRAQPRAGLLRLAFRSGR